MTNLVIGTWLRSSSRSEDPLQDFESLIQPLRISEEIFAKVLSFVTSQALLEEEIIQTFSCIAAELLVLLAVAKGVRPIRRITLQICFT